MPLLSVVMSSYNRENLVKETVDSVLNQTFKDFEFIIIDDCSSDNTFDCLSSYKDKRIKLYKNSKNLGCTFNYHVAQNLATGKYIAHIDDDDICLLNRFEKQINFLKTHKEFALIGSFIETFGENKRPSWIFYTEPELIDFVMNFYNPLCHSTVMYDAEFFDKKLINYDLKKQCAQDFDLYKQVVLKGGKLANIPSILVKYRMHNKRLTDIHSTQQIQINVAECVKDDLLSRFLNEEEKKEIKKLLVDFPYNKYDMQNVLKSLQIIRNAVNNNKFYNPEIIDIVEKDLKNNKFQF